MLIEITEHHVQHVTTYSKRTCMGLCNDHKAADLPQPNAQMSPDPFPLFRGRGLGMRLARYYLAVLVAIGKDVEAVSSDGQELGIVLHQ